MKSLLVGTCLLFVFATCQAGNSGEAAENFSIPKRENPIPKTTNGVPHVQIGLEAVPAIKAELLHRISMVEGIEFRATVVSLPGATGFWLKDNVEVVRPEVIVRGREFAHLHPDSSLHAPLPPKLAAQAVDAGWAVYHPWADQRAGWEGFVMIYTPTTKEELEVVYQLIMESYRYVTG